MSDSSEGYRSEDIIEITGKIMAVAIVLLLFIVVFVFCLHLYAKYFWYRRRENPNPDAHRRRRIDLSALPRRGLEPSLLKALPVLIFDPKDFKDGLECAVCLSEISRGEKNRLLPKCNHRFHLECIDMWFQSHSTCPLCRNPIKSQSQSKGSDVAPTPEAVVQAPTVVVEHLTEPPNFPTNVLIWGNDTRVSTFATSVEETSSNTSSVVIIIEPSLSSSTGSTSDSTAHVMSTVDTPRQVNEDDEQKFPVATRLRAFKGLLSSNSRRVNPSSPSNLDLEQGGRDQS